MSEYREVANILLVNKQDKLIMQKRDNKPGILNPGKLALWGGAMEGDELPIEGALREIQEETSLRPTIEEFEFLGEYKRHYEIGGKQARNHVFLLRGVDEESLEVFEGEGYEVVDPAGPIVGPRFAALNPAIMRDYLRHMAQRTYEVEI